jgi:2,3,4,5-tetrahydropyridine-2-carboxylate N-succinyltransferase
MGRPCVAGAGGVTVDYNGQILMAGGQQVRGGEVLTLDGATGEIFIGRVPPYSVVVSGSLPGKPLPDGTPGPSLYCAVIVKRVDEKTRAKTSVNDLLRD